MMNNHTHTQTVICCLPVYLSVFVVVDTLKEIALQLKIDYYLFQNCITISKMY